MWFLIVQILLLLLLAALFGAWLMYWWMTNRQEDVTESYAELKAGASGWNVPDNLLTRDDLDAAQDPGATPDGRRGLRP